MSTRALLLQLGLSCLLLLWACQPPEVKTSDAVSALNDLSTTSEDFRQIHNYTNKMDRDSLAYASQSRKDLHRYLTARAYQSIGQDLDLTILDSLLWDERWETRIEAAYAIGQIGNPKGAPMLIEAYVSGDSLRQFAEFNATILEAIGKCGGAELVPFVATMSGLSAKDTSLLLGQTRSLLRFALREMTHPQATQRTVDIATGPEFPTSARIIAAYSLLRSKVDLTSFSNQLLPTALNHPDPELRIPLTLTFAQIKAQEVGLIAEKIIAKEKDYRILVSLLQSWQKSNPRYANSLVEKLENHPNPHVQRETWRYHLLHGNAKVALRAFQKFQSSQDPQIKYLAAAVTNAHLSWRNALQREQLNTQLKQTLRKSDNPYHKKWVLHALSQDIQNRDILERYYQANLSPTMKSATVSALVKLYSNPKFKKYYGPNYRRELVSVRALARKILKDADPGALVELVPLLQNAELDLMTDELKKTIAGVVEQLVLPQDLEAHQALQGLLGLSGDEVESQSTRDIAWDLLADTLFIEILSENGTVEAELYPTHAPATVASFLDLIDASFFDNKIIHRVAPNFVVQDGCPRGDGYGSLPFTLNSELGRRYYDGPGILGMASAGRHTESSRWFITHRATPHLDGRYTIFGQVTRGMETVHKWTEGEKILTIKRKK